MSSNYPANPYPSDYGRTKATIDDQFIAHHVQQDVTSVKIEESRGWQSQFKDSDIAIPDERTCCNRFKFVIWAAIAVTIVAAIIALSVTMVVIHNNNVKTDGEPYTPPGVLVPTNPSDTTDGGSGNSDNNQNNPNYSDADGTLEIMQNPPFPVEDGWTALWWDEFDGDSLNPDWWNYDQGYGKDYGLWAWGNQEQQYYTNKPQNVKVSDGSLQITALREDTVLPDGYTFQYTSGRINTKGKLGVFGGMKTKDGQQWNTIRIEASIKAPEPTVGLWAAYWMLPIDLRYGVWASSGEIDIYEMKNEFTKCNLALHYGGPWPKYNERTNVYVNRPGGGSFSDQFTVAGMDWAPTQISMSLNGETELSLESSSVNKNGGWYTISLNKGPNSPFDLPFYFIINLAVGGRYPGNATDASVFPNTMTIDYLRIFGKP